MDLGDNHIKNGLIFASKHLNYLHQLVEGDPTFLWILPELRDDYVQPDWMNRLVAELQNAEFSKQSLVSLLKNFSAKEGIKFGQMMRTLRALLSCNKDGYQVAEMLEILGKESSIFRLSRTPSRNSNSKLKNAC